MLLHRIVDVDREADQGKKQIMQEIFCDQILDNQGPYQTEIVQERRYINPFTPGLGGLLEQRRAVIIVYILIVYIV